MHSVMFYAAVASGVCAFLVLLFLLLRKQQAVTPRPTPVELHMILQFFWEGKRDFAPEQKKILEHYLGDLDAGNARQQSKKVLAILNAVDNHFTSLEIMRHLTKDHAKLGALPHQLDDEDERKRMARMIDEVEQTYENKLALCA